MYKKIRNCTWKFKCPRDWEGLASTDNLEVKFCDQCNRNVHFANDDAQFLLHAKLGHCVAKYAVSEDELPAIVMGEPDPNSITPISPAQAAALAKNGLEARKDDAIENAKYSSRPCPKCSFPVASFWANCRVCGEFLGVDLKRALGREQA